MFFLCLFLLLRIAFWFNTFPNPDEAYYWLWGQYPSLSYYDHPPFHGWVQGLFTAIFGKSYFTLRLPNLISNSLFFYTYYCITRYLYGREAKHYFVTLVLLVMASPLLFLFLALAWQDHWLVAFSLLGAYQFIRFADSYRETGQGITWQLYAAAAAIALALLCKYNAVFVLAACLATILFDRRLRPLLRDHRLYVAGAIVATAAIPIGLWNVRNDFQSFRYYVTRSVNPGSSQIQWDEPFEFLLFSVLMVSPVLIWAIVRALRHLRQGSLSIYRSDTVYPIAAVWLFAISTFSLIAVSLLSTAFYYWNILAYLLLLPLLPPIFCRKVPPQPGKRSFLRRLPSLPILRPVFWGGQVYGAIFAGFLVVHYGFLPLSALVSPDAKSSDPASRMLYGWDAVAAEVNAQKQAMGGQPAILTTDYQSASALAYELDDRTILAVSARRDQFDFWIDPSQLQGQPAIVVSDDWHPITPQLQTQLGQLSPPTTVDVRRFGVWIKRYYVSRSDRLGTITPF
jgi:4-amino-4-deoxy-L-arabinose transferase-like glycosyltransferase